MGNLFILWNTVNRAKYLNRESLIIYYDIEKKLFDSVWLEDWVSLWDFGVQDDIFFIIYFMNT